jgi:hypothetical protein
VRLRGSPLRLRSWPAGSAVTRGSTLSG